MKEPLDLGDPDNPIEDPTENVENPEEGGTESGSSSSGGSSSSSSSSSSGGNEEEEETELEEEVVVEEEIDPESYAVFDWEAAFAELERKR